MIRSAILDGNNQRRIDLTVPQEQLPTPDGVIKRYTMLLGADKATTRRT
ncbi:MAG: hypothetical protein R2856_25815 [Caldilineaceae bacterium]